MKTLLLCGYREFDNAEAQTAQIIALRIKQLKHLGHEVICVMSGSATDDLLRACPQIADVELVFDTNMPATLASNLQAGLHTADDEACFAIPWEIEPPEKAVWAQLKSEWIKAGFASPHSLVQTVDIQGAPWHFGFPLLVTRVGNSLIQDLPEFHSLVDTRLKYLHIVHPDQSNLASGENPL